MTLFSLDDIKTRIIHRFENLVLDTVTLDSNSPQCEGTLSVTLSNNDSLGRDLFFYQRGSSHCLISTLSMEILALASIVCSGSLKEDEMVIFTGISHFQQLHPLFSDLPISGTCIKLSEKRGFMKYKGTLSQGDTLCAQGEMMAFFTKKETQSDASKFLDSLPDLSLTLYDAHPHASKSRFMHACDSVVSLSSDSVLTRYLYPSDHPLIKGHFPENPLMMGIMQWMSVEDALFEYCLYHRLSGHFKLSCQAVLFKSDGSIVAEINDVVCDCMITNEGSFVSIVSTQKITFRSMVRPSELIFSSLTAITSV